MAEHMKPVTVGNVTFKPWAGIGHWRSSYTGELYEGNDKVSWKTWSRSGYETKEAAEQAVMRALDRFVRAETARRAAKG